MFKKLKDICLLFLGLFFVGFILNLSIEQDAIIEQDETEDYSKDEIEDEVGVQFLYTSSIEYNYSNLKPYKWLKSFPSSSYFLRSNVPDTAFQHWKYLESLSVLIYSDISQPLFVTNDYLERIYLKFSLTEPDIQCDIHLDAPFLDNIIIQNANNIYINRRLPDLRKLLLLNVKQGLHTSDDFWQNLPNLEELTIKSENENLTDSLFNILLNGYYPNVERLSIIGTEGSKNISAEIYKKAFPNEKLRLEYE